MPQTITINPIVSLFTDTGVSNSDLITSTLDFMVNSSTPPGPFYAPEFSGDGGLTWFSYGFFVPVQGSNTVIARFRDGVNFSDSSPEFTFFYDTEVTPSPTMAVNGSTTTGSSTISYTITFAEAVTGVELSNFTLSGTNSAATITGITGDPNGAVYTITVDTGGAAANGTIGINFIGDNIFDYAGNGGFFRPQVDLSSDFPSSVAIRDINNDGHLDVVSGNFSSWFNGATAAVSTVRLGNGDGTFGAATTYASGGLSDEIIFGDFNNDGKIDFAGARSFGNNGNGADVHLGNGDGTFATTAIELNVPGANTYRTRALVSADFNQDGNLDIITSSQTGGSELTIFLGNGNGTFQAGSNIAATTTVQATYDAYGESISAGDLNGDGIVDFVVSALGDGIAVFYGNNNGAGQGTGTFTQQTSVVTSPYQPSDTKIVDFDSDGDLDIISRVHDRVFVSQNNGTGTFTPSNYLTVGTASNGGLALSDLNGDGRLDIVTGNDYDDSVSVFLGKSDNTFDAALVITSGNNPTDVSFGDVNGDGKTDILVASYDGLGVILNGALTAGGQTFTIDKVDPIAPTIALTTDNGSSASDEITSIGTLTLTGVEAGATVEYSIDAGATWASSFTAVTGSNTVRVRQTDAAGNLGAESAGFTFTLNRSPTAVELSLTDGSILESQSTANRIFVADISVIDDAVGTNTLGLTGADAARFEIVSGKLYLKAGTVLNSNTKPFYEVAVTVNDATVGIAGIDDTSPTFRLNIADVNRAPTGITISDALTPEDTANGVVVGTLSATDPDGAGTFTYQLLNNAGGRFVIVGNQVRVANGLLLDFEQAAFHNINVRVKDSTGLTYDKVIKINLSDVTTENVLGNASANSFVGGAGNDTFDGDGGADTMRGQGGNDTYIVDNASDNVIEISGGGTADRVKTSVSFTLGTGDSIEFLETETPTATSAVILKGNEIAQTITGNAGANQIYGKGGNDTLTGGAGSDIFYFDTALSGTSNVDKITDFNTSADTIRLQNGGTGLFNALPAGTLHKDMFWAAAGAVKGHDATDRIIYNKTTGDLYYDADGSGAKAAVKFADLAPNLNITHLDFVVI